MSNPTTPFSWQMPTSTDLVTDLPADFAVFGQAVATSMQYLLGGTTGQVLSKTSATDMAFSWVTPQVGDITAVNAGTGISGGGTTGDVTITNSMATAITTNGDIIYGTGSGTFARLGIGTTGQILNVAAGIPAWTAAPTSGGMTLISTTTLSGATTTLSSIPQTYNDLKVIIFGATCGSAADPRFKANGGGTQYTTMITGGGGSTANTTGVWSSGGTTSYPVAQFEVYNYASSTANKTIRFSGSQGTASSVGSIWYSSNTAVTTIDIQISTGTWSAGTVLLYGVK